MSLIFLKFASDKFEQHRAKLIAEGKEKYIEMPEFYNKDNVFFLEESSRWSYLIKKSKQNDIALLIDTALHTIEKNNKALKGALPDNYFSRLGLDVTKLASLLDTINDIDTTKDPKQDVVGKVYEYFLSKFALAEGKGKGEFYTPKSIVNLIAEMIEPYKGVIYDPACGSGGMFVQSLQFVQRRKALGQTQQDAHLFVYGQEKTLDTVKLAKMNLFVNGLKGEIRQANTYAEDPFNGLAKFDYIMANPPFNVDDVALATVEKDQRFNAYGLPRNKTKAQKSDDNGKSETVPNANYLWINLFASSLKNTEQAKLCNSGRAALVMPNSASDARNSEADIRQNLIDNNLIYGMVTLPS
ncbi:MAG TPA: class I SAM-dependent DNA methyltransferase, partial [Agitococcus sp.]|nr:class I SAM-dependent DNA methyltransferase [Agitococcus sp.]